MKWQDVYDIKPSTNIRGERVHDIYKKGETEATWVDIPVDFTDEFLKNIEKLCGALANQELEKILGEAPAELPQNHEPMTVEYNRLRQYEIEKEDP